MAGASKVTTMQAAVSDLVADGDSVAIEGFTHLICHAAGHEIIRQGRRGLRLCRMTPDLVYDQMVGAGVADSLVFSWLGNPGAGSLHAIRRAVEAPGPSAIDIEEYSHFGMIGRYMAGAARMAFFPVDAYHGTDIPVVNPKIVPFSSPVDGRPLFAVPPLNPDVAVIHVQRADAGGDAQVWGLLGCQREAALAADRVIVVCEELVPEEVVRADPNRTILPGFATDAVVVEPLGCHPSYAQGFYDRDNRFYLEWDQISRDADRLSAWLDEWVHGLSCHRDYLEKLGADRIEALRPRPLLSAPVDYGDYG